MLSGGMDSTVLLHHVVKTLGRDPVHGLSFHYGQRHARELESATWQSETLGIASHKVVNTTFLGDLVKEGSTLVVGGAPVPDFDALEEAELDQPPTYVPNRNMTLLSIAAAYAEAMGIRTVYYGAQAHDEYGYWDCTADFLERLNAVLALNRRDAVGVEAPFVGKRKSELVAMGLELGVDFAYTWSCYRGGETACGTCPTCRERRNAFSDAGETDPLRYEHE